ncbi:HET-domain-containing protein [Aspergillus bertholletiae]|uniref:HET-domain-containing protein n=1 Tax=Aspergillus bertholletiae TaxID=1226010 RepID=A0A5N7AT37_9EURO|nr:HET-domain-containing protein [Aspergillus bertholletiae]
MSLEMGRSRWIHKDFKESFREEWYHMLEEMELIRRAHWSCEPDTDILEHISAHLNLPEKHYDKLANWPSRLLKISQFDLLRQWLYVCDTKHDCTKPGGQMWPTRAIFVGNTDSNKLHLENLTHHVDYIALSHCWGTPSPEEVEGFCTTRQNYDNRLQGFTYDSLPMVFKDAVTVTRALGKQYLWIDAICIIQKDQEDWEKEGVKMQEVFASASCTIAAGSASDWQVGFLKRTQVYNQLSEITPVGEDIEEDDIRNFHKFVEEGPLNKRAWVLQERALSHRTLFFTARQTYWECGEGVRCENFTKLQYPTTRSYLIDPHFPEKLMRSGLMSTIQFVQELITDYSCRHLSYPTDKIIAFSSITKHMENALQTKATYGVFHCFLPRLLLWKRPDTKTPPIRYQGLTVPSWSWMVYDGKIEFLTQSRLKVPPTEDLRIDSDLGIIMDVRQFESCYMSEGDGQEKEEDNEDGNRIILAETGKVGFLCFDMNSASKIEFRYGVVIGFQEGDHSDDPDKKYYVLAVRETGEGRYERLGAGLVQARYVSKEGATGKLL